MSDPGVRLDLIAQSLPDPMFLLDGRGSILDANAGACRLFDRARDALLGTSLLSLVASPPEKLHTYLRCVAASRQAIPGGLTLEHSDGNQPYRCDGALVRAAAPGSGAVLFLRLRPRAAATGKFRLLTEKIEQLGSEIVARMRTEELLEGQREALELIASGAPLPKTLNALIRMVEKHAGQGMRASILLLDRDGRRLLHGAAPSLPDAYNAAIHGLEIGPNVGSCGSAAYLNEMVVVTDVSVDPRWADYRELAEKYALRACWSTPIPARDGQVVGTFAMYYAETRAPQPKELRLISLITRTAAVAIERDHETAQIRRLLESERLARAEAESANDAKDEFLALISHELRNPLNAIVGWAKVLSMGEPDEDTLRSGIDAIERNADLQARLITEMLDFSRIASGKLRLEPEAVDLSQLVREMVESVKPEASQHGISVHLDASLPPRELLIDPQRIKQVIANLLSNAIKFSTNGGRVDVLVDSEGGKARIRVSDQGCGIEPELLPQIFDRFRQGQRGRARQHEGLGLGLTIARHIIALHDGEIEVHSEGQDRGCTFTVWLPMRISQAEALQPTELGHADLSGLHVLVVDDSPDARKLLETVLRRAGASVTLAASGKEALAHSGRPGADLILCDIAMPGMDGYDTIRRWRAREDGDLHVPAVALTAYARETDRRQAFAAGFDEHMSKPIDPRKLLELVREMSGRQRA